eukprot:3126641-Alexandrium_andersonii.AAC.1
MTCKRTSSKYGRLRRSPGERPRRPATDDLLREHAHRLNIVVALVALQVQLHEGLDSLELRAGELGLFALLPAKRRALRGPLGQQRV